MQIILLIVGMILVGLVIGFVAGYIWKGKRPIGVVGDYLVAIITAVVIGLIDWFVIPNMGFSTTMRNLSLAFEPAIGALIALWVVRKAKE